MALYKKGDKLKMLLGGKPQDFEIEDIVEAFGGPCYITKSPQGLVNPLPVPIEFVDDLALKMN